MENENNKDNNNNNDSILSREKIDQVAFWVGSTVSSAFFSSLERFSCVNISTSDPDDNDEDDDHDSPQSHHPSNQPLSTATTTPTATAAATTAVVQVNGHNTNDVVNLPV